MKKKFDFHLTYEEKIQKKKALDNNLFAEDSDNASSDLIEESLEDEGWYKSDYAPEGYAVFQSVSADQLFELDQYFNSFSNKERKKYNAEYGEPDENIYFIQINHENKTYAPYYSWIGGSDKDTLDLDSDISKIFENAGYTKTTTIEN